MVFRLFDPLVDFASQIQRGLGDAGSFAVAFVHGIGSMQLFYGNVLGLQWRLCMEVALWVVGAFGHGGGFVAGSVVGILPTSYNFDCVFQHFQFVGNCGEIFWYSYVSYVAFLMLFAIPVTVFLSTFSPPIIVVHFL